MAKPIRRGQFYAQYRHHIDDHRHHHRATGAHDARKYAACTKKQYAPQHNVQQLAAQFNHGGVGDEQGHQMFGKQIGQHDQAACQV